ncbi:GAF domain-containing protein [Knoellia sp. LjRoot47]|uniref:ANTAR domain-containing protein n=1 Tax=Knoellia sp. LjRoot47 TaxID=3342330 RepID=UPI003ECCB653
MTPSVPAPEGELEPGVARELAELAHALQNEGGRLGTLQTVCELAVTVIDADHASITVRHGDGFRTVAATSDLPRAIHQIQFDTGEGPHLDGLDEDPTFVTGDLAQEHHWPNFATRAVGHVGVNSLMSHRLFVGDNVIGTLNAFAHRRNAFSESAVAIFAVFAAHAAVALQAAEEQERADNLEIALRTSRRIGTAIGILMHGHRVDERTAFAMLRRRSQDTNRKLAAIADDVVRTGLL